MPLLTRERAERWLAAGFVAALLVLGGGGTPAPLNELACQVLAALVLMSLAFLHKDVQPLVPRQVWVLAALVAAIPLLQLLPLPPVLWQALPGRTLVRDSLGLVGAAQTWQPLSIAPHRTLEAVLSLLPPLVALLVVARQDLSGRMLVLRTVAVVGLLSVAVGALQLGGDGQSPWQFYGPSEQAAVLGFQANRNAEADVLLIAALALAAGWLDWVRHSRAGLATIAALAALLTLGTVLTGSRTGVLLVPVAALWLGWSWRRSSDAAAIHPQPWQWGIAAALAGGVALLVWQTRAVGRVIARFGLSAEYRPEIWRDTWYAIGEFWPLGSGLGTFTRAIGPAERLEAIGYVLPNRAHNEYLELLLEGGAPLALGWLMAAVLITTALLRALRGNSTVPPAQAMFAAGTLTIVALHSLVDYPFRSMALAGLVAMAAAILVAPPRPGASAPDSGSPHA